jgi:tRNA dimethylallyltransferase
MNSKLLIISGPTATGKTALAVKIAKQFNGELISADSRQVYRELTIGIGKDHPKDTPIHLVDLINPDQIFSVAEFQKLALIAIADIHRRGKLPILVGGTGLYIDSVINPKYQTFSVKPNKFLRFFLNKLPLKILQLTLKTLNFTTFNSLNNSDLNNPYRLIRKIEIKLIKKSPFEGECSEGAKGFNILHLSLTAPSQFIYAKINKRVEDRVKLGHIDELNYLLTKYGWSTPGLKISAYQSLRPYFQHTKSLDECLLDWKHREHRDARHQKTWFKSRPNLTFIDISKNNYENEIIKYLNQWFKKIKNG